MVIKKKVKAVSGPKNHEGLKTRFIKLLKNAFIVLAFAVATVPMGVLAVNLPSDTLPAMKSPTLAQNCKDRQVFKDWETQCSIIFGSTAVPSIYDDGYQALLTIAYDGHRVSVLAMIPRWYHLKLYTHNLPTLAIIDGKQFVASVYYFRQNAPFSVTVGSTVFGEFQLKQEAVWVASEDASKRLIEAFKRGQYAKVRFALASGGAKSGADTEISLFGFTNAFNYAAISSPSSGTATAWPKTEVQAISEVAKHLRQTSLNVRKSSLKALKNPKGGGYFVYVPQTRFWGVKRKFIWYVGNGAAMKLNGATDLLTPNLRYPRDASYTVLEGSNLGIWNITSYGLSIVFAD